MSSHYDRLRSVYEHHLDERVKGKNMTVPSLKFMIQTTFPETIISAKSNGILKSPKGNANEQMHKIGKSVKFQVYNVNNLKET